MRKVYTFLGGHVTLIRPKMDGFLTTTFLVKNTLLKFDIDTIFDVFLCFFLKYLLSNYGASFWVFMSNFGGLHYEEPPVKLRKTLDVATSSRSQTAARNCAPRTRLCTRNHGDIAARIHP